MPHVDEPPAAPGAICPPVPALPGGQATVAGFADIDGIPGESVTKGHEHQVDIVTLHWCVTNQQGGGSGGGGGAGRASFDGVSSASTPTWPPSPWSRRAPPDGTSSGW
jgi:Type VI secretion system effector, Hcp